MRLPLNCEVEYLEDFLTSPEADHLFHTIIKNYNISDGTVSMANGELYSIPTGKLMFADKELKNTQALLKNASGRVFEWFPALQSVKEKIEHISGRKYSTCVCIYYPDGNTGVDFHSDLPAFGDISSIPSLSLGEEREFRLREKKTMREYSITLKNGSLLIMGENCQENYEHSLPVNQQYKSPRINLTFRAYGW